MTTTSATAPAAHDPASAKHRNVSDTAWRRLLRFAALLSLAAAVLMMALGRFIGPSLVLLSLAMMVGLWLLRRAGRAGIVVIGLFSLASLLVHGPIMIMQLGLPEAPASFVTGLGMALGSLFGVISAVAVLSRRAGSVAGFRIVTRGIAGLLVAATAGSLALFVTRTSDPFRPGDLALVTSGGHLSTQHLLASPGDVTVALHNTDPLFPRSFDIDALDVHLLVPPATTRRVTFSVAAGHYRFYDEATATDATSGELFVSR